MLQEVLQHDVIEHLTSIGTWSGDALVELRLIFLRCVHPVESGVLEEIDAIVKEQVQLQLPEITPQKLQEELQANKRQLEELQKSLHNSYDITLCMNDISS